MTETFNQRLQDSIDLVQTEIAAAESELGRLRELVEDAIEAEEEDG